MAKGYRSTAAICGQTMPMNLDHEMLMAEALQAARNCAQSHDVPVGAIVVDGQGSVIGRGWNQREIHNDPTAHAEVIALKEAAQAEDSWRLDDCTLYVTLEPCTMCAGAIINSRIKRVVFGADEPKTGAAGSLWDVLRDRRLNHQVEVIRGVMADESAELLKLFFAEHRAE
jgi:tRNA(adenine34) deaminase